MASKQSKKRVVKKNQDRTATRITLLLVWFLAGLYVGLAGWANIYTQELIRQAKEAASKVDCSKAPQIEYKGSTYCTVEGVILAQRVELIEALHLDWLSSEMDPLPLLLTTFAFGAVGSVVRIFRVTIGAQKLPSFYTLALSPALGGMTAVMLVGLLSLLPSIFPNSSILLKPPLIPFLSLFAGAFFEHIQKLFQTTIDKVFGVQKEKADGTPVK